MNWKRRKIPPKDVDLEKRLDNSEKLEYLLFLFFFSWIPKNTHNSEYFLLLLNNSNGANIASYTHKYDCIRFEMKVALMSIYLPQKALTDLPTYGFQCCKFCVVVLADSWKADGASFFRISNPEVLGPIFQN